MVIALKYFEYSVTLKKKSKDRHEELPEWISEMNGDCELTEGEETVMERSQVRSGISKSHGGTKKI